MGSHLEVESEQARIGPIRGREESIPELNGMTEENGE